MIKIVSSQKHVVTALSSLQLLSSYLVHIHPTTLKHHSCHSYSLEIRITTLVMANNDGSLSRTDDDTGHENVGSNGSTPPGFATPHPDLADKRLPGITHSYFGQVRSPSTTIPSTLDQSALVTSAVEGGFASHRPEHHRAPEGLDPALPTAPHSPTEHGSEESHSPMLLPHERLEKPQPEELLISERPLAYPTPPMSSPSSLHHETIYDSGVGGARGEGGDDDGRGVIGRATRLRVSSAETIPLKARRQPFALNPLSSVITSSTVHAAHISNPSLRYPSTTPTTPTSGDFATAALSSLSSHLENIKLTDGAAVLPRMKSTPPQTPRALSNDGVSSEKQSLAPTSKPAPSNLSNATNHDDTKHNPTVAGGAALTTTAASAPVGPPQGKLSVKISEARGLRPSYEPYVVCVFEWNEYISKGPRMEEIDMDRAYEVNNVDGVGGVPIRRSGSDMGRPVAIHMKSRQSSTTSSSDPKDFKVARQVTNPKWDQDAILSVRASP